MSSEAVNMLSGRLVLKKKGRNKCILSREAEEECVARGSRLYSLSMGKGTGRKPGSWPTSVWGTCKIMAGGRFKERNERRWLLTEPERVQPSGPVPLYLDLHTCLAIRCLLSSQVEEGEGGELSQEEP